MKPTHCKTNIPEDGDTALGIELPNAETYAYRKRKYLGNCKHETIRTPEGSSVSVSNLEDPNSTLLDEPEDRPAFLYVSPRGFTWGSYIGSVVERSNWNVFLRRHGERDGVFRTYGGHGSHGIAVRGNVTDAAVLRDLRSVDGGAYSYPLLDEEDWSALEFALERHALGGSAEYNFADGDKLSGRSGRALDAFRSALEDRLICAVETEPAFRKRARRALGVGGPETGRDAVENTVDAVLDALDAFPDGELRSVFDRHAERGADVIFETANGPYVDTDAVASSVDPSFVLP